MTSRLNTTVTLPSEVDLQVSVDYRAPRNTPQGRSLSITSMDAGLSRDVLKGNGTLTFSAKDIFNSRFRRSIVETEFLYSESQFQWRARQFLLTFNYRINQQKRRGGGRPTDMGGDY